jgi:hypothetical protein
MVKMRNGTYLAAWKLKAINNQQRDKHHEFALLCSAHSGVWILSLSLSLSLWGLAVENNFHSVRDRIHPNSSGRRQGLVHMRAASKAGFCSERHYSK